MELWYPKAVKTTAGMSRKHKYAKGFPQGLVVHFNAGDFFGHDAAVSCLQYGASQGFVYHALARDGLLHQDVPFDTWGSHAGVSAWPGIDGTVSDEFVGVEIMSAGLLTPCAEGGKTYWGKVIPKSDTRQIQLPRYRGETAGLYHAYTPAQEAALIELCLWLKAQAPNIFSFDNVVGHDELRACAGRPGDKQDPGGSLSMSMPALRQTLRDRARAVGVLA